MKNITNSKWLRGLNCTLLIGVAVIFIHSLFFVRTHDWDLDAFLYIGSRLFHGELLYLKDFETKLPFLQYIFALAGAFGGIGAWRIITLLISVALGFIGSLLLAKDYLKDKKCANWDCIDIAIFLTGFFLILLYSLPGSESAHLEMVSAAAGYLSFALLVTSRGKYLNRFQYFISGFFLAFAALIRPNYVYLIFIYVVWMFLSNNNVDIRLKRFPSIIFLLLGFVGLIVLSFFPYLFSREAFYSLVDGLRAIAAFPMKKGFLYVLRAQLSKDIILFYATTCLACSVVTYFFVTKYCKELKNLFINWGVPAIFCVMLLEYSFIRTHFYPHYTIMLVPYAVPLIFLSVVGFLRSNIQVFSGTRKLFLCTILLLSILTPLHIFTRDFMQIIFGNSKCDYKINYRQIDDALLNFLTEQQEKGRSFYVVNHPVYHFILGESRIGDGHPAMLYGVLNGKRIGPAANIPLYSDEVYKSPCLALLNSHKDVIVIDGDSGKSSIVLKCFNQGSHVYERQQYQGLDNYLVYAKLPED